jgi:phosphoglycerate kinase
MKTIDLRSFAGKKVLIRVDFNVPLDAELHITDDTRIRASLPTIQKVLADGGSVILMSHLGRPKDGPNPAFSLRHLVPHFSQLLQSPILFADDCIGAQAVSLSASLQPGSVLLLENLRFYKEEEKGNAEFASKLAALGDVYVNDAFGTAHRAHASTAVMAQFFPVERYFGYLMAKEVESATRVMNHAEHPFTAIMGGAKVSDKILIIENLLDKVHHLIIGGGMAFTFFKSQGYEIGNSICENDKLDLASRVLEMAKEKNVQVWLPSDVVLANAFSNDAETQVVDVRQIQPGWMGLDIGPKTQAAYRQIILASKTVLWNGPMGVFEMEKFKTGTSSIAQACAEATQKGAFTLVGGGDSVAAINQNGLGNAVSFVSTGGGALLEFMEGKVLHGIQAVLS